MSLALELSFDASSERRIRQLWVELARLCPVPGILAIGGEPHVSLAVFRHGAPVYIDRVVADLAGRLSSFSLKLAAVGAFRTDEGVVFLAPELSSELRSAHAQMMDVLGAESAFVEAYYRAGAWVPHCTVSLRVPNPMMAQAVRRCLEILPLTARVTGAAVADHANDVMHPL